MNPKQKNVTLKDDPYCVVPNIGELFFNLNIKPTIINAYYDDMHPGEYTDYGINGRTRCPDGQIFVHGAFVVQMEYEAICSKIDDGCYGAISEEVVKNGWINYAKGFQRGFDTFETDYVDKPNMLSNTSQDKAQRVFDYLSNPLKGGFTESVKVKNGIFCTEIKWYDTGVKYGQIYRAWYIVLSNHHLFEAYFEDFAENELETFGNSVAIIEKLIPVFIDGRCRDDISKLITIGKYHKTINLKGKFKDFNDILYPYWDEYVPKNHCASWYDFIHNNFTRNGKEIPKTTISSAMNAKRWN